jgi:hypothetical protein
VRQAPRFPFRRQEALFPRADEMVVFIFGFGGRGKQGGGGGMKGWGSGRGQARAYRGGRGMWWQVETQRVSCLPDTAIMGRSSSLSPSQGVRPGAGAVSLGLAGFGSSPRPVTSLPPRLLRCASIASCALSRVRRNGCRGRHGAAGGPILIGLCVPAWVCVMVPLPRGCPGVDTWWVWRLRVLLRRRGSE